MGVRWPRVGGARRVRSRGPGRLARLLTAALLVLVAAAPAPAQGDADAYAAAFRRAEIRERALGDLDAAVKLYTEAADQAPAVDDRARAELRAADCLRRLGRSDEAVALASRWSADDSASPVLRMHADDLLAATRRESSGPADVDVPIPVETVDPANVARLEEELEATRVGLARSLDEAAGARHEAAGARQESAGLAAEVRAKEREIEEMRARLPPPEPESAEEAMRLRQETMERRRRQALADSQLWARYATVLHRDGRFAEAREVLRDALAKDPENLDAKALLARVVVPLGEREQLHLRIREVLALAREVRRARLTAEAEVLLQQARRMQDRGDMGGSMPSLEQALALLATDDIGVRAREGARTEVELLLRRAEAAGIPRAPVASPVPTPLRPAWADALRAMLAAAGDEIDQGLVLRFHDLDGLLLSDAVPLPPVPTSPPPPGWTLSTQVGDVPGLLAAWLRGAEAAGLSAPGATLDVEGRTAVALADAAAQVRLTARLTDAALTTSPAVEVELTVLRAAPGAWAERLTARGLATTMVADGARRAVLAPVDVTALLGDAGGGALEVAARGTFRVTHLRPFRLAGGGAGRSVTLDVLALAGDEPGLALGLVTEWRPAGRDDGAVVSQRLRTGAALLAGGALALHGVADPASPERDLVVVARIGRRVHAGAAPTPPEPTTPEPAAGQFVAEYRLPRSVARVEEINAVVLPLPDAPLPARRAALRARLDAAAVGAASLEVRGERILVVGPESAHEGVRALLDRLASVQAPQRFRIEAFVMTRATEASLFEALPRVSKGADDAVASAVVSDGRALAAARRVLAGGAREVPLTEPIVSGPPTVRLDAPHVVRTAYRSELDTAPGEATSWGRAQTSVIDQGFVLSLRSFGRDARDRDDLDVSLRMVRVIGRDARDRRTALGDVRLLEPRTETVVADLPAVLGARDVLVLAALPSPFSENDDVRIIFLVTPLP